MRKVIKIFLGSSIVEFASERMAIENFIRNISDKFEEHYDIKIQPLLCENMDNHVRSGGMQEAINEELVRGSEMCFFIFFTKAGRFTEQEFDVAFEKYKKDGKPKIYIYFKNVSENETVEDAIYKFMAKIDNELRHYHGTFDHIDTVKLRILLSLKLEEMDFLEIKAEDGACVVDGRRVLSLDNVSEFANNEIFEELKAELEVVEAEYYELKPKYGTPECDQQTYHRYRKIAAKRQSILDQIEELQKNIFNMSLRICQDETRGEITARQKEAYRLFEKGDLEGANRILDFAEIKNEHQRRKAMREAEQKKDDEIFIREGKTKIGFLSAMTKYEGRFDEIEQIYEEIVKVAFEQAVELDAVYDYASYLDDQNKAKKTIEIAKELLNYGQWNDDEYNKAKLFNLLGISYDKQNKSEEAEDNYLNAIEIMKRLVKKNSDRFEPDLAISYNNVGGFYIKQGQPQKAEEHYIEAIKIYKRLVKKNSDRFEPVLAKSYWNYAMFKDDDIYFKKSFELAEKHPNDPYCKQIIEILGEYLLSSDIIDIRSKGEYPSCALSNFAKYEFVVDGVKCNSMEGFLQSLKFKSVNKQRQVCLLSGKEAKNSSKHTLAQLRWRITHKLYWQGKRIDRFSEEYQALLDKAYDALAQNEDFITALKSTGDKALTHSIGKADMRKTVLTENEFISKLEKIRKEIR